MTESGTLYMVLCPYCGQRILVEAHQVMALVCSYCQATFGMAWQPGPRTTPRRNVEALGEDEWSSGREPEDSTPVPLWDGGPTY